MARRWANGAIVVGISGAWSPVLEFGGLGAPVGSGTAEALGDVVAVVADGMAIAPLGDAPGLGLVVGYASGGRTGGWAGTTPPAKAQAVHMEPPPSAVANCSTSSAGHQSPWYPVHGRPRGSMTLIFRH
ncbi:MAG: hypothetical protein ACYDB6_11215 [Candidatus Limnocylindrales bacterium]